MDSINECNRDHSILETHQQVVDLNIKDVNVGRRFKIDAIIPSINHLFSFLATVCICCTRCNSGFVNTIQAILLKCDKVNVHYCKYISPDM